MQNYFPAGTRGFIFRRRLSWNCMNIRCFLFLDPWAILNYPPCRRKVHLCDSSHTGNTYQGSPSSCWNGYPTEYGTILKPQNPKIRRRAFCSLDASFDWFRGSKFLKCPVGYYVLFRRIQFLPIFSSRLIMYIGFFGNERGYPTSLFHIFKAIISTKL